MRWEKIEIEKLSEFVKSGKTYKEISEMLTRSESSIRNKSNEIGIMTSMFKIGIEFKEVVCLQCGILTSSEYENRKFCSHSCSAKYNNRLIIREKKNKNCLRCGISISRKNKYCSNKCQVRYIKNTIFEKIESGDITLNERNYKTYLISKFGNKCMDCD